ncbi:flavin-containing monooxygenase [Amycolatopsis circi]|uniref:flavin-containing monooxygenase n=1 Tax=Amycolatopsis circi TaxID=871959 RepID=UPI000E283C50|nr:NAD(P)/FAD-dependent oxidoreductase [Amycolatopsis circi]
MHEHEVLIIGSGFAGLYQLYRLREAGFDAHVVEAGEDVGGTWYWNRYPGARCDIDSIEYSYSFDDDLQQEWEWTERFAAQPEIHRYLRHVADRFGLRKDITFNTRVQALEWSEAARRWTATTTDGTTLSARFVIAATGNLSVPTQPDFPGLDDFEGETYSTARWPEGGVDLSGKRVAVIGTGSSGLQTITTIAPAVGSLTVFQRTPCFSAPAHNRPIAEDLADAKSRYSEIRENARNAPDGYECRPGTKALLESDRIDVEKELERRWADGGLCFGWAFTDLVLDLRANEVVAEYFRDRIRSIVADPVVAEKLCPTTYPIFTKRMCVDTGYYQVYNRPNVELVDLREEPLVRVTPRGILAGEREHEFDVIILATGFDAMTGALNAIDIRNGEATLKEKWTHGPRTYLGLMSSGFPNLFTVTGPQSPSVLSNMVTSIEHHVGFIARALEYARAAGYERIEAEPENEDNWVATTNDLANMTIFPMAASWYMGANVPGKERIFMPFVAGVGLYKQVTDGVEAGHYHGFEME